MTIRRLYTDRAETKVSPQKTLVWGAVIVFGILALMHIPHTMRSLVSAYTGYQNAKNRAQIDAKFATEIKNRKKMQSEILEKKSNKNGGVIYLRGVEDVVDPNIMYSEKQTIYSVLGK